MTRIIRRFILQLLAIFIFLISTFCYADNLTVNITHKIADSEKCMDLFSDQKTIVFNDCHNTNSQKWRIETAIGKYSTIKNSTLPENICLFSTTNGNTIEMRGCSSGTYNSQTYWELITADKKQYSLRSKVQVDYGRSGWLSLNDNKLTLNVDSTPTGKWHFIETTVRQTTAIMNRIVGLDQCMDLGSDKKKIAFNVCNGVSSQQWVVETVDGYNTIKNSTLDDNICLFSTTNGNAVEMRQCNSGTYNSQTYWSIAPKTHKKYSIISKVQKDYGRNGELSVNNDHVLTLNNATASVGNWSFSQYEPLRRSMKGTLNVLLLNTHFTGISQRPTNEIRKALFGGNGQYSSLSEYLALASRGTLIIKEGKTIDNLDIGNPGDSCNSRSYRDKAIELAKAQGINPDNYDLIYVEHTYNSKCSYAANAILPSKFTTPGRYIVSNASGHKYWMWTHEFGHTLGFKHSNILADCSTISTGVIIDDYCQISGKDGGSNDISDTMGGGGGRMYPVNYMHEAGWLTDEQFPVVGNGTYKIDPLLDDKGGKQGIRIARNNPNFPYLTLEFRQANRFDSSWAANSPFINGIIVREINPQPLLSYNVIIHTIPGSSDRSTPPLMPGKTLYDTYSGKAIKVDSIGSNGAIVTISDYISLRANPEWSESIMYTAICQKIAYAGDTWVNGWGIIGTIPGSDGEWGVWRKTSSDNVFDYCKPEINPESDMMSANSTDLQSHK